MSRRTVSILCLAVAIAILIIVIPDVVLVIFAGILVAVLLRGAGGWVARRLGIATGWGIALLSVVIVGFAVAGTLTFASDMAAQLDQLSERIPQAFAQLRDRVDDYHWGRKALDELTSFNFMSREGRTAATLAVSSTLGALGNFVVIVFVGIYGALDPSPYRNALLALLAPSIRPRGATVIDKCVATLRNWVSAQLISMTVVGVLTGLGLWAIGLPLAFILGVIAGLLTFIPNIGPILSAVPALLLAFIDGWDMVLWVLGVYVVVQTLESYFITPFVQQEKVSLPPALVISVQVMFGTFFGILGLALAMPLSAMAITLIRELYVHDYLERDLKLDRRDG